VPSDDLKPANRLLSSLPGPAFRALRPHLERVALETKQVLFNVDVPIEHVYFPEDIVVSVLSVMQDGSAVEVATVGREGMVGLPVVLGAEKAQALAFVQVPGHGMRVEARFFREHVQRSGAMRNVLDRYTQALFTQLSQNSACNRLHSIEERCARWLLMTHDRVGADSFPLTQQFLAQMLGVRRAGVSEVASQLQREGLMTYQRGHITLKDRAGLEAASCECYRIIQSEFDRLVEGRQTPNPLRGITPNLDTEPRPRQKEGNGAPSRRKPRSKA
jgi:CRP-like cAMP-binding protein